MGRVKSWMEVSPGMRSLNFQNFFPEDRIKDNPGEKVWN